MRGEVRNRCPIWRGILAALVCLLHLVTPVGAATAHLTPAIQVSGTTEHAWVLSRLPGPGGGPGRLHYNNATDAEGRLYPIRTLASMPVAFAAWDDTAYFVVALSDEGSPTGRLGVRRVSVLTSDPAGPHRFSSPRPLPPIPVGGDLLDFVATASGPAFTMRVDGQVMLMQLGGTTWNATAILTPELEAGTLSVLAGEPVIIVPGDDHALVYSGESLAEERIPWLAGVLRSPESSRVLVTREGDDVRVRLLWGDEAPVRTTISDAPVGAVAIEQGERIALYWTDAGSDPEISLRRRVADLNGKVLAVEELRASGPMSPREVQALILVMGSVFLTIVVFILKPERDDTFPMPEGAALADPARRMVAFLFDLLPAGLIAAFIWGRPVGEVLDLLGILQGKGDVLPLLTAAGILIATSAICEAIWGRTPGKLILGCRVVSRSGGPPPVHISVARNAVKVLCPPLGLFVIISPGASRPGDFQTRVIVDQSEDADDEAD